MAAPDWKARIHPELRGAYKMMPNLTYGPWSVRLFRLLEPLAAPPAPRRAGVTLREVAVGQQRLRLFQPEGGPRAPAALLWIHGGGRLMGTPKSGDYACARIAETLGILAASTSYRFAPEHPYPAPLDDCAAAWRWLSESADELGIDPARVIIAGESAGGGLAAELAQRLHDEGGVQPRGQALVYPMLDDHTAADRSLDAQRHPVWNNRSNHYGWASYLGTEPGSPDVGAYAAAARREDLSGLPPVWMTVGELDLFRAEILTYQERLRSAGVSAEVHEVEGGFHGYFAVGRSQPPIQEIWASLESFLRRCLDLPEQ